MTSNIGVLIVEKAGTLKTLCVKAYKESELYKRCGFKSDTNFQKRCDWRIIKGDKTYTVSAYGKAVGRIGFENNYSFPSHLNNTPLFGNCVLVLHVEDTANPGMNIVVSLDVEFWTNLTTALTTGTSEVVTRYYTNADPNISEHGHVVADECLQVGIPEVHDIENDISVVAPESDDDSDVSELLEEEYLPE
jgi:hypothetical protein